MRTLREQRSAVSRQPSAVSHQPSAVSLFYSKALRYAHAARTVAYVAQDSTLGLITDS
ncbi:MAG: hypothetical protein F6K37_20530 [Moorea sp. SIO4E2]|nr:hypothetical protein [Moorena sp. SIO4E2]